MEFIKHGNRLFDTHKIRKVVNLNGLWHFDTPIKFTADIEVPSCWEKLPQLANYRGKAVYTKEIDVEKDTDLRFFFEGVSFFARVYLDKKFLCKHYNAYTPFAAVARNVTKGKHVLKVVVSNKFGLASALHVQNDYYSYGGITRGVQMEYITPNYVDSVGLIPQKTLDGWNLHIRADLVSLDNLAKNTTVSCKIGEKYYTLGAARFNETNNFVLPLADIEPWSPTSPKLYEVALTLSDGGNAYDDIIERTGFREVKADISGFYVNGERIFIKGVNRHEDYNYYGSAVPFEAAIKDLELIKEANANAIRTCHYPNDSLFLDMCDEQGFLVWEETHSRGLSLKQMCNPHFDKQVSDCGKEMLKWHIGHPSIVIWGCLNECADKTHIGRLKYKKHIAELRAGDTSRPITFASCKPFKSKCLDLEDIVSYNLYFSWIIKKHPDEGYPPVYEWTNKVLNGVKKPIIISEFGAGAVYGRHDETAPLWSEEKQRNTLEENIAYYASRPEIIGIFIWQFCDHRVCENHYHKRIGGKNNKGIVNEFREKKLAFDTVKNSYRKV